MAQSVPKRKNPTNSFELAGFFEMAQEEGVSIHTPHLSDVSGLETHQSTN